MLSAALPSSGSTQSTLPLPRLCRRTHCFLAAVQASHRIAPDGALVSVLVLAWVGTSTAKGDYRLGPVPFGNSSAHRDATVAALLSCALTWVRRRCHDAILRLAGSA